VKSSAGPKDYHFDDIALRLYVFKGAGIVVSSAEHTDVDTAYVRGPVGPRAHSILLAPPPTARRAVRASRRRGGLASERGLRGGEAGDRDTKRRT
jgi:hypothetical protein